MPTISQLPPLTEVTPADAVPVSQAGVTHSVSIGTLLASMQPAIIAHSGALLGRISLGAGSPEAVAVGTGLLLKNGTLTASDPSHPDYPQQTTLNPLDQVVLKSNGEAVLLALPLLRALFSAGANVNIDSAGTISATVPEASGSPTGYSVGALTPTSAITANDLVAISQSGTDHAISYVNFLDGLTIDAAQPASTANDTDTLWVGQGSSTMLRQSFAAIWSWFTSKFPSYKQQVVEITADTLLDGTVHNGRMLICSQAVTLSPAPLNMGSGFSCVVLNLSSGNVNFGTGITTSSGVQILPSGQAANLSVATYSGGTVVYAFLTNSGGGGTMQVPPGQVTELIETSPTASSVTLSWSAPATGGAISTYTIQYRLTGTSSWSTFATGLATTTTVVTGLASATSYDFQVFAVNGGGAGTASSFVSASTSAAAGSVTSVTWNMVPSGSYVHRIGSIGVNAHINPSTAAVQFGFSQSATVPPGSWVAATYVNSDLWGAYVSTPGTPGAWYAWVVGTDGSGQTAYPTSFTVT